MIKKTSPTLLVLVLCFMTSLAFTQKRHQPNILWITCEDISPTLSFYGDKTAKTPTLDKLADESLIYSNAFATVGVCAPSRSSLITGMYPISIGTMHMRTASDVSGWGKRVYNQPSMAVDINGDPVPHYAVVTPPEVKCFPEYLRASGYYTANNQKTDYQFAAPVSAWDANGPDAHWRNRAKDQPFFAVFNFNVTHESKIWVNADKPLTVDPEMVPIPPYFPETATIKNDIARNYSNIELLDQQISELLKQLEDDGLLNNTIVFFFSDHGGPLPRGKREHYDSGLKVPLLIRFPNGKTTGTQDQLISFVDFAPTILSLAGLDIPEHLQGNAFLGNAKSEIENEYIFGSGDRFDEFSDRSRIVRDKNYLYVRNFHPELPKYKDVAYRKNMPMMPELLRMNESNELSGEEAEWFTSTKPSEELYDVKADPHNMKNIANDPAYSDKMMEMKGVLESFLTAIGDKGREPELDWYYENWPKGVQPTTGDPILVDMGSKIVASTTTEGASLIYIISDAEINPTLDSGWQLYQTPVKLKKSQFAYFMATRIGYADSEIIKIAQ